MISQYGQDLFVLEILFGQRGGFFLDSGASDGVKFSNTLLLEKYYGWQGICVEPNSKFFRQLEHNRNCPCINVCFYDTNGSADFLEDALALGGILAEYAPDHLAYAQASFKLKTDKQGLLPTVPKATRTIRSVLQQYDAPRIIDYWSLDTEGSELTLLKSFPFDEYSFRILTIEHNWLPQRKEIREFLAGAGYRFITPLGCDDCYVREKDYRHVLEALAGAAWRSAAWRRRGAFAN
ncbi:FkbM family methyltransferase [Sphingomonas qilianensis]|uniref:FkbM family methyltransferase n=1 Tax=Sphingomonas qilianensis TaxID=1736690 RepID=A0ABU9XSZ5_9SPHN